MKNDNHKNCECINMILEKINQFESISFSSYTEPLISIKDVKKIIESSMNDITKCEECSRRKWYQIGFNDGLEAEIEKWIPVTKQLPEEDERYKGRKVIDVLVTTAKGKVTKVQRQSHDDSWLWGRIYGEPKA